MNAKMLIGVFAVFSVVASIGAASAYRGDPTALGPNYDQEIHNQIEATIEAGDYEAWVQAREQNGMPMNGRMFQVVNNENFDRFAEMHQAMEAGDTETANTIRAELGLGQGSMNRGQNKGNGQGMNGGTDNRQGSGNAGNCPYAS